MYGPAWAAPGVPIGQPSASTGLQVLSLHVTDLDLSIQAQVNGQVRWVPLSKHHAQRSTLTVLRAGGSGPDALQVQWQENRQSDGGPDGKRSFDLPVSGSTYTVDLASSTALRGGVAPSPDEARIVTEASDLFTLQRQLRAMVPAAPEIGVPYPVGHMFGGIVRDAPGEVQVDGTLTLTGVRLIDAMPCAIFDLVLHLRSEGELEPGVHASVQAELSGEVVLEVASGWTRSLRVSGTIDLHGGGTRLGQVFTMVGSGPFVSETTLSFSQ